MQKSINIFRYRTRFCNIAVYRLIGYLQRIIGLIVAFVCIYLCSVAASYFVSLFSQQQISDTVQSVTHHRIVRHYTRNGQYDRENNRRIYFHESTGRSQLNFRQSCAIESAAKHNPTRSVQVFMLDSPDFDYSSQWLDALSRYNNIEIILVNETEYFMDSPLEKWYNKGVWLTSPYKKIHLSDYLRMLTLFKGGGLYLDIDILTLKELKVNETANFFVVEDRQAQLICNSVFHLDKKHRFVNNIIKYLVDDYDPLQWGYHGGEIITAIMRTFCGFKLGSFPFVNDCRDIQLFPSEVFFPIIGEEYDIMFLPVSDASLTLLNNGSYGVHVWNSKSHHDFLDMQSKQLYAYLAKKHCPFTATKASQCENYE